MNDTQGDLVQAPFLMASCQQGDNSLRLGFKAWDDAD